MTDLLSESLVDKRLKEWIMPNFSTSTKIDRTVSAITLMASMKAYFDYTAVMRCGIPSVTLEGTKIDWNDLLGRLDKLAEFGEQTRIWATMLKPIISKFITAFDGEEDRNFWGHVVSEQHLGSGISYLGGWITAFCAFNDDGKFTGSGSTSTSRDEQAYVLNGISYPIIKHNGIPGGRCEVDLKIIDRLSKTVYETVMVAGNMATRAGLDKEMGGMRVSNMPIWYVGLIKVRGIGAAEDKTSRGWQLFGFRKRQ